MAIRETYYYAKAITEDLFKNGVSYDQHIEILKIATQIRTNDLIEQRNKIETDRVHVLSSLDVTLREIRSSIYEISRKH